MRNSASPPAGVCLNFRGILEFNRYGKNRERIARVALADGNFSGSARADAKFAAASPAGTVDRSRRVAPAPQLHGQGQRLTADRDSGGGQRRFFSGLEPSAARRRWFRARVLIRPRWVRM